MHRDSDGEQVRVRRRRGAEHLERGQVHAGSLDLVERLPGAPGPLVVLDARHATQAVLPLVRRAEPAPADERQVGPVLGGVARVRELPVDHRGDPVLVLKRVPRTGIAVHHDAPRGGTQVLDQPVERLVQQRYRRRNGRAVHLAPVLELRTNHCLRVVRRDAVKCCHGGRVEPMKVGERAHHVVQAHLVRARGTGHMRHHEERVAEHRRVRLLPQHLRDRVAERRDGTHDGDLAPALGREHAALLDPHHAVTAGPLGVEHQPAEATGDHRYALQDDVAGGEPRGQPGEQVGIDRRRAARRVAVVPREHVEQRRRRGELVGQLCARRGRRGRTGVRVRPLQRLLPATLVRRRQTGRRGARVGSVHFRRGEKAAHSEAIARASAAKS